MSLLLNDGNYFLDSLELNIKIRTSSISGIFIKDNNSSSFRSTTKNFFPFCKNFLNKTKKINDVKFLYGGSVNSRNFFEIKDKCKVDGALIGGASLLEKEITNILKGDF